MAGSQARRGMGCMHKCGYAHVAHAAATCSATAGDQLQRADNVKMHMVVWRWTRCAADCLGRVRRREFVVDLAHAGYRLAAQNGLAVTYTYDLRHGVSERARQYTQTFHSL